MKHKNSHFNQIEIGPEDINRSSLYYSNSDTESYTMDEDNTEDNLIMDNSYNNNINSLKNNYINQVPDNTFEEFNGTVLSVKNLVFNNNNNSSNNNNNNDSKSKITTTSTTTNSTSAAVAMSPITYESTSTRPISPILSLQQQLQKLQQQQQNENNNNNNNTEEAEFEINKMITELNNWISKVDYCLPSARAIVWDNLKNLNFNQIYQSKDPSDVNYCSTSHWSSKRTSKFRSLFNSITREPIDIHAIRMLNAAFLESFKNNKHLLEQSSPQTTTDEEDSDDITVSNPFLVKSNIFYSASVWDCGMPAVLQQLFCLNSWAPQLDKLPSHQKKMIWELCLQVPIFKEVTSNIKLNNFTKTVKIWINNPIFFMSAVTILFGSIGYLVENRFLNNSYSFPSNPNCYVFKMDDQISNDSQQSSPQQITQPSSPQQMDQQIDDEPTELNHKKKKVKKSGSKYNNDQSERVPSMSPLPKQINKQPDSPLQLQSNGTSPNSPLSNSEDTSDNERPEYKRNQQIGSISSMIDKVFPSTTTTTTTTSTKSSSTLSPAAAAAANKRQSTRSRSASLNSYHSNKSDSNHLNNNKKFNNISMNLFSSTNIGNNNHYNESCSSSMLNSSSDSVPVTGYNTPIIVNDNNASAVPEDIAVEGSSLDVLAMTAFQFGGLDEITNAAANTTEEVGNNFSSTPLSSSTSSTSSLSTSTQSLSLSSSSSPAASSHAKKAPITSFLNRKRRYSSELVEKDQDSSMQINNILCS